MKSDTNLQAVKEVHHGRTVKRFRVFFGVKQDILADNIQVSQQTVSRYELQEVLNDDVLNKIAKALHIPVEWIKDFDEEMFVQIISNAYNQQSTESQNSMTEKIRIYEEQLTLYKCLLKVEQDNNELLKNILKEK